MTEDRHDFFRKMHLLLSSYIALSKFTGVEKFRKIVRDTIDDYAKDGGSERSDFYVVLTMSLCVLESKQTLISLLF